MGAGCRKGARVWSARGTRGNGVKAMAKCKRKYVLGRTVWREIVSGPGSTAQDRRWVVESGFASKREAEDAEANRRADEIQKYDLAKAGSGVAAALPKIFSVLLEEFMRQHAEEKLALKTIERYGEQLSCLDPELLKMPLADITPLHLSREWSRLLKSGGHTRRHRTPLPLSSKQVRNLDGVVSSAFTPAITWGLVSTYPFSNSEPPIPRTHEGFDLIQLYPSLFIR